MPTYEERQAQREAVNRMLLANARETGFRDCHEVFDALGFERVNAGGMIRSSLQVSARWIVQAGFALEQIVPDGYTDIPKAERCGCHVDDLPEIVRYKNAYYAGLPHAAEWRERDDEAVDAASARRKAIEDVAHAASEERQEAKRAEDVEVKRGMRSYVGPLNQGGYPRNKYLRAHLDKMEIDAMARGQRKKRLWDEVQAEPHARH